jgi:hypothetical protein
MVPTPCISPVFFEEMTNLGCTKATGLCHKQERRRPGGEKVRSRRQLTGSGCEGKGALGGVDFSTNLWPKEGIIEAHLFSHVNLANSLIFFQHFS